MRRDVGGQAGAGQGQGLAGPQLAGCGGGGGALPGGHGGGVGGHRARLRAEVEQGQIPLRLAVRPGRAGAGPHRARFVFGELPRAEGRRQQPQHLAVGQQAFGKFVQLGQLGPQHERRAEQAPQAHQRALFVAGQGGGALCAETASDAPQRQHVAVRESPGRDMVLPELAAVEHRAHILPFVPQVVGDAPHVGVLRIVPRLLDQRRARRKRQHDVPPAVQDRVVQVLDLGAAAVGRVRVHVGVGDVVALDEIDAPRRIHGDQVVVIRLRPGVPGAHAVHVGVPAADAGRVGQVGGRVGRAVHGQAAVRRRARDAAHDVDAELEAKAVHIVGQRAEAPAPGRGREARRVRLKAAVLVHGVVAEGDVLELRTAGPGVLGVPLDVNDDILPAIGLELPRQHLGIGAHVGFGHGRVVIVVAVPPHRRGERSGGMREKHGGPPCF